MQHFSIWITGEGELDGTYPDVAASTARAALGKIIGKPYQSGMQLTKGQKVTIEIKRWD